MKAAIVKAPKTKPVYGDFEEPVERDGFNIIQVRATALSQLTKSRASGNHYSADGLFPAVAGTDGVGVTRDGKRVYFALPEHPFGSMGERSLVRSEYCIPLPGEVDDIVAAAIANPGMSAWAALMERARLQPGETVLVNGATGTAGRIAIQLAKFLGAKRVIGTGRNEAELEDLKALGADDVVLFTLGLLHPAGAKRYEAALIEVFGRGVDVVIDYLWGASARGILAAIAKGVDDARPVRFVHVGGASGEESIDLPGVGLRSSSVVLMGSGYKSVPLAGLMKGVIATFEAVIPAQLRIATKAVPLSEVERFWDSPGKPRIVFTLP